MINVWCVCVGKKYSFDHVDALAGMIKKNLRRDYHFNVISESIFPGWWAKIDMHKAAEPGPNIYLDLDTVIVGDITPLVEYYSNSWLAMPKNWSLSGHGGFQSSVQIWSGQTQCIYDGFDPDKIGEPGGAENCPHYGLYEGLWGDQELITRDWGSKITEIQAGVIVSYKYHCMQSGKPPTDAKIVCFHGSPNYWDVNHEWVSEALS